MLLGVQVQHELGERALEPRRRSPHHGEARLGEAGRPLEVQQAELDAQDLVGLGLELEPPRRAPAPALDVLVLGRPGGHRGMRQVRQLDEQRLQPGVSVLDLSIERLDPLADVTHAGHGRLGAFAPPLGLADGFRGAVALGLELFRLREEPATRGIGLHHGAERDHLPTQRQRALDFLRPLANQSQIQHRGLASSHPSPYPLPRGERVKSKRPRLRGPLPHPARAARPDGATLTTRRPSPARSPRRRCFPPGRPGPAR